MAKTTFKCTATSWSVRLCWALEMTKQLLLLLVQWVNSTVHCLCVSVNQLVKLFSLFQVHSLTYKQLLWVVNLPCLGSTLATVQAEMFCKEPNSVSWLHLFTKLIHHTPHTPFTHTYTRHYFIQSSKCCGRCHESETCLGAAIGRCHDSRISFNIFLAIYFVFLFRFCSLFTHHAAVAAIAACFGCRQQWHLKHKVQGKQAWEGAMQHCNQQCHSSSNSSSCRKGISF